MDLSTIPNDVWNIILSDLELKDVVNFYKVYPTTINKTIYNYINLQKKTPFCNDYMICYECIDICKDNIIYDINKYFETHNKEIYYDNEDYDFIEMSKDDYLKDMREDTNDDDDLWYSEQLFNEQYTPLITIIEDNDYGFFDEISNVYHRCFTEACYKYKYKYKYDPEKEADGCIYHDEIPQHVLYDMENRVLNTYLDIIKDITLYGINVCQICYGINHDPYDEDCYITSELYAKKYFDELEREKQKIIQQKEEEEKEKELKRQLFLKTVCLKCKERQYSIQCLQQYCGTCCKCHSHRGRGKNKEVEKIYLFTDD